MCDERRQKSRQRLVCCPYSTREHSAAGPRRHRYVPPPNGLRRPGGATHPTRAVAFVLTGALSLIGQLLRGPNEPTSEHIVVFAETAADSVRISVGWSCSSARSSSSWLQSALVLIAGIVMSSVAIWRSQVLPEWSAVPYAAQVFCLTIAAQFAYPIELAGGVLLMVASIWLAVSMWRLTES